MAQAAYDLEMFEDRARPHTPRVRAVKGKKTPARIMMRRVRMISLCAVMVALICGLLISQAKLTELTGRLQTSQRQLVDAQSQYNYLSGVLDSKTGQKNVEEIATTQLGLMKLDRSQITYFTLDNDNAILRPKSTATRLTEFLTTGMLSLADYLNP